MTLGPRAVVVHRRTELDELLARHGTRGHAAFYLAEIPSGAVPETVLTQLATLAVGAPA